jgi:hypothetical protein
MRRSQADSGATDEHIRIDQYSTYERGSRFKDTRSYACRWFPLHAIHAQSLAASVDANGQESRIVDQRRPRIAANGNDAVATDRIGAGVL